MTLWVRSAWHRLAMENITLKGEVYFLLHLQPTMLFQVRTVVRLLPSYSKHLRLCFTLCAWWFLPENRQCLSWTDKPAACDHTIWSAFLSNIFQSSIVMTKGFIRPGKNSANPLYFCTYPGNWRESFCRKTKQKNPNQCCVKCCSSISNLLSAVRQPRQSPSRLQGK